VSEWAHLRNWKATVCFIFNYSINKLLYKEIEISNKFGMKTVEEELEIIIGELRNSHY
jgi:hypothetical protein